MHFPLINDARKKNKTNRIQFLFYQLRIERALTDFITPFVLLCCFALILLLNLKTQIKMWTIEMQRKSFIFFYFMFCMVQS